MPNWITNHISTSGAVIAAMLNSDGRIDFSAIAPFPGPRNEWNGFFGDAEQAAEIVCGIPVDDHPLVSILQRASRREFDIKKLSAESFAQFVGFLENYRACGYLHSMEFARQVWGTKWNACEPVADVDAGTCSFDTAWSCPEGVLIELSKRHPDEEIKVVFADEDIGSNCGQFTLKGGQFAEKDVAPPWREMDDTAKAKWKAFAHKVKGTEPEPEEIES